MLAADFGVGQVLWSLIWFFLLLMWIMTVFRVFGDIITSPDLSGGAKAAWSVFVIFLPFLGVLSYLIARGGKMAEHQIKAAQAQEAAVRGYIRDAAGTSASPAEELAKLATLRDQGVIDQAEFDRLKARIVG
jgi:hypothetical protein